MYAISPPGCPHRDYWKRAVESSRPLTWGSMERMRGIEPPSQAWEACVLPLNHIRLRAQILATRGEMPQARRRSAGLGLGSGGGGRGTIGGMIGPRPIETAIIAACVRLLTPSLRNTVAR